MPASTPERVKFVNPVGQVEQLELKRLAQRLHSLRGKRIGLINTGKPSVEHFLDAIEILLQTDYPDASIVKVRKDFSSTKASAPELDGKVDAAIIAWGD